MVKNLTYQTKSEPQMLVTFDAVIQCECKECLAFGLGPQEKTFLVSITRIAANEHRYNRVLNDKGESLMLGLLPESTERSIRDAASEAMQEVTQLLKKEAEARENELGDATDQGFEKGRQSVLRDLMLGDINVDCGGNTIGKAKLAIEPGDPSVGIEEYRAFEITETLGYKIITYEQLRERMARCDTTGLMSLEMLDRWWNSLDPQ